MYVSWIQQEHFLVSLQQFVKNESNNSQTKWHKCGFFFLFRFWCSSLENAMKFVFFLKLLVIFGPAQQCWHRKDVGSDAMVTNTTARAWYGGIGRIFKISRQFFLNNRRSQASGMMPLQKQVTNSWPAVALIARCVNVFVRQPSVSSLKSADHQTILVTLGMWFPSIIALLPSCHLPVTGLPPHDFQMYPDGYWPI